MNTTKTAKNPSVTRFARRATDPAALTRFWLCAMLFIGSFVLASAGMRDVSAAPAGTAAKPAAPAARRAVAAKPALPAPVPTVVVKPDAPLAPRVAVKPAAPQSMHLSVERRKDMVRLHLTSARALPRHFLRSGGAGNVSIYLPGRLAAAVRHMRLNWHGIGGVDVQSRRNGVMVLVQRQRPGGYRSCYWQGGRELIVEVDIPRPAPRVAAAPAKAPSAPVAAAAAPATQDATRVVALPQKKVAAEGPLMPLPEPRSAPAARPAPAAVSAARPAPAVFVPERRGQVTSASTPGTWVASAAVTAVPTPARPVPSPSAPAPARLVAAIPGTWRVLGADSGGTRHVTLDFLGAEIQDVLKALAIQSGSNIMVAPKVDGKITVGLHEVTPEQALDFICRLAGLGYGREENTYVVAPREQIYEIFPAGSTGRILFPPARETAGGPVQVQTPAPAPPPTEVVILRLARVPVVDAIALAQKLVPGLQAEAREHEFLVLKGTAQQVQSAQAALKSLEAAYPVPAPVVQAVQPGPPPQVDIETYTLRHVSAVDAGRIVGGLMAAGVLPKVVVTPAPAPTFPTIKGEAAPAVLQTAADPALALANLLYGAKPTATAGAGAAPAGTTPGQAAAGGTVAIPADSTTNTLLLIGARADIDVVRRSLERIDVAPRQVMIDLKVTDVSRSDEDRLGVSWNWGNFSIREMVAGGDAASSATTVAPNLNLGRFGHLPVSFNATLEALVLGNKARILANPRIAVLDGQTASIHVGDTIRYLAQRTVGINGTTVQIGSVEAGVVVQVAPRIGGDNVITLDVRPRVNVVTGYTATGDGGQVPNTSERSVETVVRLRDGETLAIGGLIRDEDVEGMQKVPGLGDLPFLGSLFKFRSRQKKASEVLIFITPTLVPDPS